MILLRMFRRDTYVLACVPGRPMGNAGLVLSLLVARPVATFAPPVPLLLQARQTDASRSSQTSFTNSLITIIITGLLAKVMQIEFL
jgi:hypothetical protein